MEELQARLEKALVLAKATWEKTGMPRISEDNSNEIGKIAIAILAAKLLDEIPE
ncbi:MAG TPA: hypothetical protein VE973_04185 [Candidatus Limnocylindria bacterium]|nr:hypothetical protein [Candidatus Limnocylindria bacterium]